MATRVKAVEVVHTRRVRCTYATCRAQARAEVPVREVVPGVLEVPRYVCASCGRELKEER